MQIWDIVPSVKWTLAVQWCLASRKFDLFWHLKPVTEVTSLFVFRMLSASLDMFFNVFFYFFPGTMRAVWLQEWINIANGKIIATTKSEITPVFSDVSMAIIRLFLFPLFIIPLSLQLRIKKHKKAWHFHNLIMRLMFLNL